MRLRNQTTAPRTCALPDLSNRATFATTSLNHDAHALFVPSQPPQAQHPHRDEPRSDDASCRVLNPCVPASVLTVCAHPTNVKFPGMLLPKKSNSVSIKPWRCIVCTSNHDPLVNLATRPDHTLFAIGRSASTVSLRQRQTHLADPFFTPHPLVALTTIARMHRHVALRRLVRSLSNRTRQTVASLQPLILTPPCSLHRPNMLIMPPCV